MIRAIVINPFDRTVKMQYHRDWNPGYQYRVIGSPDISSAALLPNMKLVVDEFNAYRVDQKFAMIGNYPVPTGGRCILIGVDPETGETRDVPFVGTAIMEAATLWCDAPSALSVLDLMIPAARVIERAGTLPMPMMPEPD